MNVHDLVACLVGWNELVLMWHAKRSAGEDVVFPESSFKWNELGGLAQKFYRDYESPAFPDLLRRLEETREGIVRLVESRTNEELLSCTPWYEQWSMGRMIQFNTSSP